MCELLLSPTVNTEFAKLTAAERQKWEKKLVRFAGVADVNKAEGLEAVLCQVDDWSKIPDLKFLRKWRIGNHRVYVAGQNTDCRYIVQATLLNKKDQDDKPKTEKYQKMILNSIASEANCLVLDPKKYEQND